MSLSMFIKVALSLILLINPSESFSVKVIQGQIVARLGSTVTLPCWISPPLNAEHLEIRWYRHERFNTPLLFYNDGKIQAVQEEEYRRRSSLTQRSSQSDGLKDGDVSLRLENVTVQDEGVFHCYVSGERSHESQSVTLNIAAVGSAPVLFRKAVDDTHMNVSCRSSGWFPDPSVMWLSDRRSVVSAGGVSQSRGDDGTFSVHSWTLVSLSDTSHVFCLLSLNSGEEREGGLDIQAMVASSCSGPWKALFFTSLVFAFLGLFGFILYKQIQARDQRTAEQKPKQNTDEPNIIEQLRKSTVVITLNRESAHPDLKFTPDLKAVRDSPDYPRRDEEFPYELNVQGLQSFSSGRHYWEVELVQKNLDKKMFWLIGVVKEGSHRLKDKAALSPSNGFWFLCSDGPKGLSTNTEPAVTLSLSPSPPLVGVLLDYDDGKLSFYDVTESKHLLTINTKFSGSVAPLFNPGVGDTSPLRIKDLKEPETSPEEPREPLLQNSQNSV